MKTIPRHVKKAFLISSFIGSILKSNNTGKPILSAIERRTSNGMHRFKVVAGSEEYVKLTQEGIKIWVDLSEKYTTKLTNEEVEIFIEFLGYLLSPKDYYDFLKFEHFTTNEETTVEKLRSISNSVLALNDKVNELLGTRSYTMTVRKPKAEKVKKPRDKSKKQKEVKPQKKSAKFLKNLEEKKRKVVVKSFLQQRIEAARKEAATKEADKKDNHES